MKLVFATDLHLGASAADFHQQTYDPTSHAAAVAGLRELCIRHDAVALLLCGDMTHATAPAELAEFVRLFSPFTLPMVLCLGNHDVCVPESLAAWHGVARQVPNLRLADTTLHLPGLDVVTINTHWADAAGNATLSYKLGSGPRARLAAGQLEWLDAQLSAGTCPAIVMLHGELHGIPPELTGMPKPIHVPEACYADPLNALLDRHPRVKLALYGHNHVNSAQRRGGRLQMSTGSLTEVPFYARVIDINDGSLSITTVPVMPARPGVALNPKKEWVLGHESDRTLSLTFRA